jgi:hypothetical protein
LTEEKRGEEKVSDKQLTEATADPVHCFSASMTPFVKPEVLPALLQARGRRWKRVDEGREQANERNEEKR